MTVRTAALFLLILLVSPIAPPFSTCEFGASWGKMNVFGMTVTEVRDHWPQAHETTVWRGHEYNLDFSLKMEIELVVHDDDVDEVVKVIMGTARTGCAGDGYDAVLPIEHRDNIRTGERDVS